MCNYEIQFETEAISHKNEETVVLIRVFKFQSAPPTSRSALAGRRERNRRHTESRCQTDSYGKRAVSAFSHDRVILSLLSVQCACDTKISATRKKKENQMHETKWNCRLDTIVSIGFFCFV